MKRENDLQRFVDAQANSYSRALSEIKSGRKQSHWMWFVFPQLRGLGRSETAQRYGIADLAEADAYLKHPILGSRLIEITEALLTTGLSDAYAVFGSPDDLKLRSCMTLFAQLKDAPPIFRQVLDRFFNGKEDPKSILRT